MKAVSTRVQLRVAPGAVRARVVARHGEAWNGWVTPPAEAGSAAAYDNHLADTATETYDRELDYSLEENSEHVLADIDAALKRIEDGTYGICTNCGKQIPEERLEARPWATLCIDCQRDRERR